MFTCFDEVVAACQHEPRRRIAVAVAEDHTVLEAVKAAIAEDIAHASLFGNAAAIEATCERVGLDPNSVEIVDAPNEIDAANAAVRRVSTGNADILMKGHIHTDDFLRAVLNREQGLRTPHIMSHVFILELREKRRFLFVTDGAFNIAPDLRQKAAIILNAVYLAQMFGIEQPRVGVLAAVEVLNPKMQATLDAAALATMGLRGQFSHGIVDGPFALDNAVSEEAARHKGIGGPVAGRADILLVPDIEAGNILAKSHSFLAGGNVAGVVVGAAAPIVLTSRADSPKSKLYSIATAVLMANMERTGRFKFGEVHY